MPRIESSHSRLTTETIQSEKLSSCSKEESCSKDESSTGSVYYLRFGLARPKSRRFCDLFRSLDTSSVRNRLDFGKASFVRPNFVSFCFEHPESKPSNWKRSKFFFRQRAGKTGSRTHAAVAGKCN